MSFLKTIHNNFLSYSSKRGFFLGLQPEYFLKLDIHDNKCVISSENGFMGLNDRNLTLSKSPYYFNFNFHDNNISLSANEIGNLSARSDNSVIFVPHCKEWELFKLVSPLCKVDIPYFEIHAVDTCNLNCIGCSHFCPLTDEANLYDPEQFYHDMIELSKKINCPQIRLMGGEPLLHPNIDLLLSYLRFAFPNAKLHLVTNGILLPAMDYRFFNSVKMNSIIVDVTHYPGIKNFYKSVNILKEKEIPTIVLERNSMLGILSLSPLDIQDAYRKCPWKFCRLVHQGKLYPCAAAAFTDLYNRQFNTSIPVHSGLDIYNMDWFSIMKTCYTPCPTCAHCDFTDCSKNDWEPSSLSQKEWLNNPSITKLGKA